MWSGDRHGGGITTPPIGVHGGLDTGIITMDTITTGITITTGTFAAGPATATRPGTRITMAAISVHAR